MTKTSLTLPSNPYQVDGETAKSSTAKLSTLKSSTSKSSPVKSLNQLGNKADDYSNEEASSESVIQLTIPEKQPDESCQLKSFVGDKFDLNDFQEPEKNYTTCNHYETVNKSAEITSQESSSNDHYVNLEVFHKVNSSIRPEENNSEVGSLEKKNDVIHDENDYVNIKKCPLYENLKV